MRISHQHRFVFFSNPKTGSESVRALLDPLSDVRDVPFFQATPNQPFYSHIRPIELRAAFRRFGWKYGDYYSFVFVRNPWTRLASLYRYMLQKIALEAPLAFGDWLKGTLPDGAGGGGPESVRWLKYGTYTIEAFAGDGDGNLLVNDVFRLEDMAEVPGKLRERGVPIPANAHAPWVNGTRERTDLSTFYTEELIEFVRQRYAKEIADYGYSYPGDASVASKGHERVHGNTLRAQTSDAA